MMEIGPIRNPPVDEHTELINLLELPFLPISERTIAEILRQFAEWQQTPGPDLELEQEQGQPLEQPHVQVNGGILANITNIIFQT